MKVIVARGQLTAVDVADVEAVEVVEVVGMVDVEAVVGVADVEAVVGVVDVDAVEDREEAGGLDEAAVAAAAELLPAKFPMDEGVVGRPVGGGGGV